MATYLPIPKLIAIKTISVLFDGLLGLFTFFILSLKFKRSYAAMLGVVAMLFAPTIFINSAAWGQADATYAALCLGSLYFLLKERPGWACALVGLAIAFKLQAIFFLPVLLVLLLKRRLALRYLALIPAVFLLMLAPAFIAGRGLWSLLTIYVGQISSGNGGGGFNAGGAHLASSTSSLTLNAPSFYQWLPANTPTYWMWIGIALAALFVIGVAALVVASKQCITSDVLLKLTLLFAVAIPFLLPEMHERYFYLADVVSIIYAFSFPRLFFIALLMQLCSLLSYTPYLMSTQLVSLSIVAFGVLVIVIITLVDLVLALYPGLRQRASFFYADEAGAPEQRREASSV